jgi:5-methylcytosine-specific restriction endonuclease McrA
MDVTPDPKPHRLNNPSSLRAYRKLHPFCEVCGRAAHNIHHLLSRGAFGGDEWSNLISLCIIHHREAHNKPGYNDMLKERKRGRH